MTLAETLHAEGGLLAAAVAPDAPGDGEGPYAGDRLYALGLALLAEQGDVRAVAVLADLISECASAHAEDQTPRAAAAWDRATSALRGAD